MKLEEVKGMRAATAQKLRRAGIGSAQRLSLVDVAPGRVPGMTTAQLASWKRKAQHAVYEATIRRIRAAADDPVHAIEGVLAEATWAALGAARLAQQRGADAARAARLRTRTVAAVAAAMAHDASRRAHREYRRVEREVARLPSRRRAALRAYQDRAARAAQIAARAAQGAQDAVRAANQYVLLEARAAHDRGTGLLGRIMAARAGPVPVRMPGDG